MRIAMHARIGAGKIEQFNVSHCDELTATFHELGVTSWIIWRNDADLFHFFECNEGAALSTRLQDLPENAEWLSRMAELMGHMVDLPVIDYVPNGPIGWRE